MQHRHHHTIKRADVSLAGWAGLAGRRRPAQLAVLGLPDGCAARHAGIRLPDGRGAGAAAAVAAAASSRTPGLPTASVNVEKTF